MAKDAGRHLRCAIYTRVSTDCQEHSQAGPLAAQGWARRRKTSSTKTSVTPDEGGRPGPRESAVRPTKPASAQLPEHETGDYSSAAIR
jgi:hypothetical protein